MKAITEMKLYEKQIDALNNFELFTLYDFMAFMYLNMELYDLSLKNIIKCCVILENGADFDESIKQNCYKKMGIISFFNNNYTDTVKYLLRIAKKGYSVIGINYAMLFYSLEKLNRQNEILEIINNIEVLTVENKNVKAILDYYCNKYTFVNPTKEQYKKMELLLCEEMSKVVVVGGTIFEKIFKEEIRELVSITKNYKNFFLFDCAIR